MSIENVCMVAKRKDLNGIAITDHNSIEGGLKLKDKFAGDDFIVIIREEIKTSEGEITGLFLRNKIPPGLSPEETIQRIKSQGGLVSVTHPFCRFRKSNIGIQALMRIMKTVDLVEVFNSRNVLNEDNKRAYEFAKDFNKLKAVGSDAHLAFEYGRSYVRMMPFDTVEDFKKNLASAELVTRKSPLWVHLVTKWRKLRK